MTIFLTISKGLVARNILQNDFYRLIKERFDSVVILTTASQDDRFIQEFSAENVTILPLENTRETFLGRLINNMSRYIIYNGRTEMMSAYNYDRNPEVPFIIWYPKYICLKMVFKPLSNIKIIRRILQWIDVHCLQKDIVKKYQKCIQKYRPDIIFATSIVDDTEAALIKAAKKEKVKTIAMVKSWDNFSKKYFSVKSDVFAVWNQFMLRQAIHLQDYEQDHVKIVGIPQFDYYVDTSRLESREAFCKRVGLDPEKKIIFFGSEGKLMPTDPSIVHVIKDFIKNGELIDDCQIFVRPHFAYTNDREKFKDFLNEDTVIVDDTHHFSSNFSDTWDYSEEQMNHFLNCIYHSSMVINTASTLTADAIALDKPVILIQFEGYEKKSKYEAVAGWYTSDYYSEVMSFHAAHEAKDILRLKNAINICLKDPDTLKNEREKFKKHFCYAIDGKSGERLSNMVTNMVKKTI